MANKQYSSPIRLFDYAAVDTDGELNILRIKKQLNAEFEISTSGILEIDGYTYNKEDVFEELSLEDFPQRLIYHQQLWKSKKILDWLEKNTVNLYVVGDEFEKFYGDKIFDRFFSPYFSGPFNYTARNLINNLRGEDLGKLLAYEDFLQPSEREDAFKSIRLFLEENLGILKNISDKNYGIMRPKLTFWLNEQWQGFVNNLPDEYYEEKTDLVILLINLTVTIQKWQEEDSKQISTKLILLDAIPEHLKDTISKNYAVFFKAKKVSYTWIFWVIFILIKIFTFNGCQ